MRNFTMTALALCAMAAMGTTTAFAMDTTYTDCHNKADQVRTALDANQASSNYSAAKKESDAGRDFCQQSQYRIGVDHYAAALKLLGVAS
jgi:ABC-type transporter MlaC component